jgi:hypothetical protein
MRASLSRSTPLLTAFLLVFVASGTALAAPDKVRDTSATTYTLVPMEGAVRVKSVIKLANERGRKGDAIGADACTGVVGHRPDRAPRSWCGPWHRFSLSERSHAMAHWYTTAPNGSPAHRSAPRAWPAPLLRVQCPDELPAPDEPGPEFVEAFQQVIGHDREVGHVLAVLHWDAGLIRLDELGLVRLREP